MRLAAADAQAEAREAFEKQGSDPTIVKKAIEDAANLARNLWISFLTFGTYLVITVAGVTHEQLFRETPVKLPLLNADLPLVAFFWVAPILFLIFHLYLLLNLKLLADQVHHYGEIMRESGIDAASEDRARLQLPNFVIVQILGGTREQRHSAAGVMLSFTAWLTLVAAPVILILFMQVQFLPYHSEGVTRVHRLVLFAGIALAWWFWPLIKGGWTTFWRGATAFVACIAALYLSWFVMTFPGEPQHGAPPQKLAWPFMAKDKEDGQSAFYTIHEVLFATKNDREPWFQNRLVLRDFAAIDRDKLDKIETREKGKTLRSGEGERTIDLRRRDFSHADFTRIDLRRADLRGANLKSTLLVEGLLQGASLEGASLQGALLNHASLQGASFDFASLQVASLYGASLQGASFDSASLRGALLYGASLQGASLEGASLQGASLNEALLQGASLIGASLQGASLVRASLQGALLDGASLQGTWLYGASLQGAWLDGASLQGASLDGASLQGTLLDGASLWRTAIDLNNDFRRTFVQPAADRFVWWPKQGRKSRWSFDRWRKRVEDAALKSVPENKKEEVKSRLAGLDFDARTVEMDRENRAFWQKAARTGPDLTSFRNYQAEELIKAACSPKGAPYTARGIARNVVRNKEKWVLPLIEKLLDPTCRGTQGFFKEEQQEFVSARDELRGKNRQPEE
jgi:uncharacterized protein YjbI with pentapeptide repeats